MELPEELVEQIVMLRAEADRAASAATAILRAFCLGKGVNMNEYRLSVDGRRLEKKEPVD